MTQCKIFTGIFPENDVNNFLLDNPNFRYIDHSQNVVINNGQAWITMVVFYDTNPGFVQRPNNGAMRGGTA